MLIKMALTFLLNSTSPGAFKKPQQQSPEQIENIPKK
jgi:hypothetical protein